jgi:galactokinase
MALNDKDTKQISELMAQSPLSLKEDFTVTVPEIDILVNIVADVIQDKGSVHMTCGDCLAVLSL